MSVYDEYRLHRVIRPAMSMNLIKLDRAKDVLGIPAGDTSQDGMLGRQIASVSAAINTYCDRIFVRQGYRDTFRSVYSWCGYGRALMLRRNPICVDEEDVPIVIVTEDNLAHTDFEVDIGTGALYRLDTYGAPHGWGASLVVVEYDAGFDPIPDDVQAACTEWVAARWSARGRDPTVRSQTIPDVIAETYTTSADSSGSVASIPGGARDLLAGYIVLGV